MEPCNCKICKTGLGEVVNNLAQSESIESISKNLWKNYQVQCNSFTLKKHLDCFGITYTSLKDKAPRISLEIPPEGEYHEPIDLNDLTLNRWGLADNDPVAIVKFLQEKLLCLSFQQMEIVASQQRQYLEGRTHTEPGKDSISNLRVLLNLADKFTAISLQANQQQAVRVVQSLGYEAEGLRSLPNADRQSD